MSRGLRTGFDPNSGLQFTERTCQGFPNRPEWTWKTLGSTQDITNVLSNGAASLQDMAIRHLCRTIHYVTPELLAPLPSSVSKVLWERIVRFNLDSLLLWKVFVVAYPDMLEMMNLARRDQTLLNPILSLSSYSKSINSPSLDWINILSVADMECTRQDLIGLCGLNNLGLLKVGPHMRISGNYEAGLDESIIRNWARAATESRQFRCLRVFVLHGQRSLLGNVWTYLDEFPVLSMVLTYNCNGLLEDWQKGKSPRTWPAYTDRQLWAHLAPYGLGKEDRSWRSLLYAAYHAGGPFLAKQNGATTTERIAQLPILQLALGSDAMKSGDEFLWFRRIDGSEARKRKTEKPTNGTKHTKMRRTELSSMQGRQEIAFVLEAFGH